MDPNSIARALVDEISASVDRHVHPRTGRLMPPRVHGRRVVANGQLGELVIDQVDELLEAAVGGWGLELDLEVSLDLCHVEGRWLVEWAVETGGASSSGDES